MNQTRGTGGTTPHEFDFVIVGAGSSGCVLANRLSAHPQARVLLIEAGGPASGPIAQAPGKWTSLLGTAIDWNYSTEPEPALGGRRIVWPRGKGYGGSSAISAMAYVRGHQLCFDAWAGESGPSWSFGELLPYFRRVEDNSRGASDYRGAGGPLAVSDTTDPHAGHLAFLEAARAAGFAARPDWDFNGAHQEQGAGYYQKNIRQGRRHSAASAFLEPVLARPNLTVWPNTQALRLVLDGKRVTAIDVARAGARDRVRVTREVVLAAGAIESPKLLLLSGIGPAAELKRLGIPVAIDLAGVGANLHDHPRVPVRWTARQPLAPSSVSAGLFTFSGRATSARPPDIQFYVGRGLDTPDPSVTLTVALSQPASRGRLTLRSTDPLAPPLILANYFAEAADMEAILSGVRLAQALGESSAYAAIRGAATDPGPTVRSTVDLSAYVRRVADTIFHPVGTCRMGIGPAAVVDPQLRVYGIEGLRIADASIMPTVVNSQTHAACVVIGERAGELMI
jgi:choline dehydrogenase